MWTSNFFLSTVETVVCSATPDTFFGDIDLGEMFLNYFLDKDLQSNAGVDVTNIADLLEVEVPAGNRLIIHWELERDTGFLIHMCLTFENFKPY